MTPFNRAFVDEATQTPKLFQLGGSVYTFGKPGTAIAVHWYSDLQVKRDGQAWGWVVDEGDGSFAIHVAGQPGDSPAALGTGVTVEQALHAALRSSIATG